MNEFQQDNSIIFEEDFSSDLSNWWFEGSERISIENGRLYIDANGQSELRGRCSTVWSRIPIHAENLHLEFDAHVLESSRGVNNINFFLHYSHSDSGNMYETRDTRLDGGYGKYHDLTGYIFTYVRDVAGESKTSSSVPKGRIRIRRCPGFGLLSQNYTYDAEVGRTPGQTHLNF